MDYFDTKKIYVHLSKLYGILFRIRRGILVQKIVRRALFIILPNAARLTARQLIYLSIRSLAYLIFRLYHSRGSQLHSTTLGSNGIIEILE